MQSAALSSDLYETEKITPYLWLTFFICFFGNILAGLASTLMSVYLPVVVRDFFGPVGEGKLANISAVINAFYFVGWAVGGLAWGFISDRIGRSRSLALTVSMFGLFTFLKALAPSVELIFVCQFFCGFGVGGVLVVNTTLLSEIWPLKTRSVFIGLLSIGFPIGIFSSGIVNYIISDWRQGFMIGGLPFVLGIVSPWLVKESSQWSIVRTGSAKESEGIGNYKIELVSGIVIFGSMLIGLWAVFSWLPTWVQSIVLNGDGQQERSLSMMLMGIGGLSGGFFSGWISNVMGTRKVMLFCFAGCFLFSLILFKANSIFSTLTLVEIGLLAFMFGISQGALSVYIPMLFPVGVRASATGICFNIGRFFTAGAVFFVGTLVDVLGGYGNSLLTFCFVFVLGFVFLYFNTHKS